MFYSVVIDYKVLTMHGESKQMYKEDKFLKKLWCCVGGEYYKIIWFYQLS